MFFLANYISALSFFSNLSSSNYLVLSMPFLGLYINFLSKILYILCYSLVGNFRYPLLAYYLAILSLCYGPRDTSGINNKTVKARP
jgi:hypothetical protein